jgi:hypothetical protein
VERGERSDLDRKAEIRSALIKPKSSDLGQTPEIQQPGTGHELGGAARSRDEGSSKTKGDDHDEALGVWGIARTRLGRSAEPDRGHHAGAGAPESVGHGESG